MKKQITIPERKPRPEMARISCMIPKSQADDLRRLRYLDGVTTSHAVRYALAQTLPGLLEKVGDEQNETDQ